MKKLFAIITLMTTFVSASFALELSEKCEKEMLGNLKAKSLSMLFPVYLETNNGQIDEFVGIACSNGKREISVTGKKQYYIKLKVNPWFSPTEKLTVACDPSQDFPVVQVRIFQSDEASDCLMTLTKVNTSFNN